ncbi:hypothetical protein LACDD01_02178 [Lactococcus sp. DD01]|nr:hypothetical protein LACDD01_02178 [Lactococcus sp. DD01]
MFNSWFTDFSFSNDLRGVQLGYDSENIRKFIPKEKEEYM